jgi:cell division transport system permease protein
MANPSDFLDGPQALIPADHKSDRPMFMVVVILAFLSTLALLGVKSSFDTASKWRAELQTTATVQIKPTEAGDSTELAQLARDLISDLDQIETTSIQSAERSAELLKPWLGDTPLPDDLPLPVLLDIKLKPGQPLNSAQVTKVLQDANIRADIDDHQRWSQDIKRSTRAVQMFSVFSFLMVALAILAAVVFATRAGLTGRRTLIDVLHQVGATPAYTARLFARRFALSGFKAGLMGALLAVVVLLILGTFTAGAAGSFEFIPSFKNGITNFILAFLVPVFVAAIAAMTAWRTVLKTLFDEVYP